MIDLRPHTLRRHRRALIASMAIPFVFACLGVTWTLGPRKDRSIAFPCMDRACGCHDAAGCKEHCCCFSDDEKLAWAVEHHVDPTPFVSRSEGIRPACSEPRSCCVLDRDSKSLATSRTEVRDEPRQGRVSLHCVSVAAERQCRGLMQLWSVLPAALPTTSAPCLEFDWVCWNIVTPLDSTPIRQYFSPPTPPPRG